MTVAQDLLMEAHRRGVLVLADGDDLHLKAVESIPSDLAERIRGRKAEVLALLDPQRERFAHCDAEADAGRPVYDVAYDRLPDGQTPRQAGVDCLILAFATRRRVRHWLDLANGGPLDADVLENVAADVDGAQKMLDAVKAAFPHADEGLSGDRAAVGGGAKPTTSSLWTIASPPLKLSKVEH